MVSPAGATPIAPSAGCSGSSSTGSLKRERQFTLGISAGRSSRTTPLVLSMAQVTTPVSPRRGRESDPAGTAPGAMTDAERPVA